MPHIIRSLQDLQAMADNLGGHYALGASLDARATAHWNGGAGFVPIGRSGVAFRGSFNGMGHTIDGLSIHRPGENHVGLFGYALNATLRNVGVVGGRIQGAESVGGLVGYFGATDGGAACISHAYATAQVQGALDNAGGLVGHHEAYGGTSCISGAYACGAVRSTGSNVGGLVGHNEAWRGTARIANAYAMGPVAGRDYAGGLVGYNDALEGLALISHAYATGAVTATGAVVGGLVGMNSTGTVEHSFYAITDQDGQPINRGLRSNGQGKTLDALKQRSTFAGWRMGDGNSVWRIDEGHGTPQLRRLPR